MKKVVFWVMAGLLLSSSAFAIPTVTLSGPSPALAPSYAPTIPSLLTYTVTNNVPKNLPISISGLSNGIQRTTVDNDCGSFLQAGPSTCHIGITIDPSQAQAGTTIHQTLQVNFQGRAPLTSQLAFSVSSMFAYALPTISTQVIEQFVVDAHTGQLSSNPSTAYSSDSQHYQQLTFAQVNGVRYAYVTDSTNMVVHQCSINNADGSFHACTSLIAPPDWMPYAITFATINEIQYAYITDVSNGNIYKCSLSSDGSFSGCSMAASETFLAPYGIAFATINNNQYAYITDAGQGGQGNYGKVYQCQLNSDGTFVSPCTAAIPSISAPLWIPYSIAFTSIAGTQYAYVGDNGTNTFPANGNIYQCRLDSHNGLFTQCNPTPSSAPQWAPYFITFATVNNKQYIYVADAQDLGRGGMYRCALSDNNAGELSDCQRTPASLDFSWNPVGISLF